MGYTVPVGGLQRPTKGKQKESGQSMAGLCLNYQKNAIAATTAVITAFKICISHRKNGLLNRLWSKVSFPKFSLGFVCMGGV
jgi:hypothetical protein